MTPIQLAEQKGISYDAILAQARRMKRRGDLGDYEEGFGKTKELPPQVINFYLDNSQTLEIVTTKINPSLSPPVQPQETNDTREQDRGQFDLGEYIFFHPTAQFGFVVVILAAGAYIFASLAGKLYPGGLTSQTFILFFAVGFLVDSSGIIFAKNYRKAGKWDNGGIVHFLLFVLLCIQIWIESSYMFYEDPFTWSGFAVVCVRPLGQYIYSEMYLNQNQEE